MLGRRRYVTVLFSDVSGSTEYAERLEAEDLSLLLDRFRALAHEIVPHHGGVIARFQGDGFLALFGHDAAHEDDGRRATEAALDVHAAVSRLRVPSGTQWLPMQLHSGVHAGLVLLLDGDIERGRLDVVGEVVHTAARLCSAAGPGEILVSTESLGPHGHFFRTGERQRVGIRGRLTPLDVLRVAGRADHVERRIDAAARRGVVPFVGRDGELELLAGLARQAHDGEPSALHVSGEPGIGKTRLIDEFQRRLDRRHFQVMQGYCEAYLGAEPLQPFLQAIRGALGWNPARSAEEAEAATRAAMSGFGAAQRQAFAPLADQLLGLRREPGDSAAGAPVAASAAPGLRASSLIDFMLALAGDRTLVLVLDDWQWADDASRHVLEQLRARERPMFVLLAARPFNEDDHALVGAGLLRLAPLDAAESQRAIAGWLPNSDPFMLQEITQQAGGSPLFIEELCQVAATGSSAWLQPRRHGLAWIDTLVASRFERLPSAQADCLRRAAVAGTVFPQSLLARLCGAERADALAQVVAAEDFIVPAGQPGMLRFRHALTRDAVYAMVDPLARQELHLQVALALEAGGPQEMALDPLDALAHHYDAARVDDKAARFAEAAGDRALVAMALDRARAHFTTALGALDRLPVLSQALKARWCAIAQKLGQTCVFDPLDVAASFVRFERAVALARETGDQNALARAEYWLAYVNYGKGRPRESVRHGETALALAEATGDLKLHAQVQATLAQALASSGRYTRAMPLFAAAVANKRQQSQHASGGATAIGSAYTLGRMAYTFGDLGRFDEAHEHFAESLRLLGDKVHSVTASVKELICAVHLWQGRWEEAEAMGRAGAEMALRCRSRYLTSMGQALAACGAWAARRDPQALASLRERTAWIEARGGAVSTSLNYGWLVEAAAELALEAELRAQAARLFMRARAQDRHGEAQGCRALSGWAAARGDFGRAERYLAQAARAAAVRESPRENALNDLARGRLALARGQAAEARARIDSAGESFERLRMAWHLQHARELMVTSGSISPPHRSPRAP